MPQKPLLTQRKVFSADGASDAFLWAGGPGSLSAQGDMGGGTLVLECYLRMESTESGDPESGTYATVTDSLTGNEVSIAGPAGEDDMEGVSFNLPTCYVRMRLSSSTSPDFVGVVGRDINRVQ